MKIVPDKKLCYKLNSIIDGSYLDSCNGYEREWSLILHGECRVQGIVSGLLKAFFYPFGRYCRFYGVKDRSSRAVTVTDGPIWTDP